MTHRWKVFACQTDFPEKSVFCCTTCQTAMHEQRRAATKTEHVLQAAWWAACVMPPRCQGACVPASVIVKGTTTPIQTHLKWRVNQMTVTNGIGLENKRMEPQRDGVLGRIMQTNGIYLNKYTYLLVCRSAEQNHHWHGRKNNNYENICVQLNFE